MILNLDKGTDKMGNDVNYDPIKLAVLGGATEIFAGFAAAGKLTKVNDKKVFKYALNVASKMADSVVSKDFTTEGEVPFPW